MYRDLSLPFAILVVLGTAVIRLADYIKMPFNVVDVTIAVLFCISVILLALLIYTLWRSWAEHPYCYPAYADKVKDYGQQLAGHYGDTDAQAAAKLETQLKEFILAEYVRCASRNAVLNDARAEYVKWSKRIILILTVLVPSAYLVLAYVQIWVPIQ